MKDLQPSLLSLNRTMWQRCGRGRGSVLLPEAPDHMIEARSGFTLKNVEFDLQPAYSPLLVMVILFSSSISRLC